MRGAAGYARIFGRVAALAVAFGIGVTVATMPGVAWADASGPSVPSPPDAAANDPSQDAAPSPDSAQPSNTDAAKDSSADTGATVAVGDSPEATYGVSGGASITSAGNVADDATAADETPPASSPSKLGPAPAEEAPPAAAASLTTPGPSLAGSKPHTGAASRGEGAVPVHLRLSAPWFDGRPDGVDAGLRAVTSSPAPIRAHADPMSESTIRVAAGAPAPADGETTGPMALPGTLLNVASGLLVAVLAPFLMPTPATPADTPVLWAVLGWARRQLGDQQLKLVGVTPQAADDLDDVDLTLTAVDADEPSAHTVGSTSTVDQETGWVTGWVFVPDPDDDRVSYTGTGPTGKGDVIVYEDASFLYKPTARAREFAAAIGGDKDTFTIRVSDGRGHDRSIPVTVDVLPAA